MTLMIRMEKGKLGEKKMVFGSGLLDGSRRRVRDWMGKGNAEGRGGDVSCLAECVLWLRNNRTTKRLLTEPREAQRR